MKIVHWVAGHVRIVACEVSNHLRVPVRLRQNSEGRRYAEVFDKTPGVGESEGTRKGRPMSDNPQEFVSNRPGDVPYLGRPSPLGQQPACLTVLRKFPNRRIDQQVSVNDEHAQSFFLARPYSRASRSASRRSYNASRSATFTLGGPALNVRNRNGRLGLRASRIPRTRYSVTSADRVSLRSAARRFKSRNTGSGMIRVVFIWKTIRPLRKDVKCCPAQSRRLAASSRRSKVARKAIPESPVTVVVTGN